MINNPLNAVDIRGEVLTTYSVWDDTDIVHVLRDQQIIVPDYHYECRPAPAKQPLGQPGREDGRQWRQL